MKFIPKTIPFAEFIALMALLISLGAMSTDAMLPALMQIGLDLGVTQINQTQLVISSMFAGFAVGQIFYGPLSDFIGRRNAVLLALAIFTTSSFISVVTSDFTALLASRFFQGLGAAGPRIIAMALIRDLYEGRAMSFIAAVFIIVPALAPIIGGFIFKIYNWRSIFLMLTFMGLTCLAWFGLRQSETLPVQNRNKFSLNLIKSEAAQVVKNRRTAGYTIVLGLIFGMFLSYISTAQQIFEVSYKLGDEFPIYFAINALALGVASMINAKLVMIYGMRYLSLRAMGAFCVIAVAFLPVVLAYDGVPPLWTFMAFCMSSFFCVSILFGNLNAMAMEPMGKIAGMAAALIGSVSTFISLPIGVAIGQLFEGTLLPMVASFALIGAAAFALLYRTSKISDG